jgi:hypothetical protein
MSFANAFNFAGGREPRIAFGVAGIMGRQPDIKSDPSHPTMEDAERACDELHDQIERAKKVLSDYRMRLVPPLADNQNRKS